MKSKIIKILAGLFLSVVISGAHRASAFSLGDAQQFNVDSSYDYSSRVFVNATVQKVSEKALFYVEDDWWNSSTNKAEAKAALETLSREFDSVIYPRLTSVFGSEWSPGIDNEFKITILITKLKDDAGGYFNMADEYPRSQATHSNEREMIYLNSTYFNSSRVRGFLAHEFQHLITFYQKEKLKNLDEETWLNEARSEYSSTLCGYDDTYGGSNLEKRVGQFLRRPSDSLTEWNNQIEDYGSVNLFTQYLVSHYGEQILTEMMRANAVGIDSVNQALINLGRSERFPEIFTNWTITNFVNDCSFLEPQKFCYSNRLPYAAFHLTPSSVNSLTLQDNSVFYLTDQTRDWAGYWYELAPISSSSPSTENLNLDVTFQGNSQSPAEPDQLGKFQLPILIYNNDGSKSLQYLLLNNELGSGLFLNFGSKIKGLILIPTSQTKLAGSFADESPYSFSLVAKITSADQAVTLPLTPSREVSTVNSSPARLSDRSVYPDGSLIRANGDSKVYVINGQFRRWLQSPAILAAYPHLDWQNVIEVTSAERDWYQDAWFIRAAGDSRVYEINGDLSKHWLNMTAEQFSQSGRSWDSVFIVNKTEKDLYKTGAEVIK